MQLQRQKRVELPHVDRDDARPLILCRRSAALPSRAWCVLEASYLAFDLRVLEVNDKLLFQLYECRERLLLAVDVVLVLKLLSCCLYEQHVHLQRLQFLFLWGLIGLLRCLVSRRGVCALALWALLRLSR